MPLQEPEVTGQLVVTSDEPMGTRIAEQSGFRTATQSNHSGMGVCD